MPDCPDYNHKDTKNNKNAKTHQGEFAWGSYFFSIVTDSQKRSLLNLGD